MTSSSEDIGGVLTSLTLDAGAKIARAIDDLANEFLRSGGYGTPRMHAAGNERITAVFRTTVNEITLHARRSGGGHALRALVDAHLSRLIDQTIQLRVEQMGLGKMSPEDASALCDRLHHDLKRLKDAVVRDIRPDLQ